MTNQTHNQIVNFIWSIADDCLRDVYVRGKYRDVILPMVVIRRLDAVLEDTKEAVLKMKADLDKAGMSNQSDALCNTAGQAFCNSSPFTLKDLRSRSKQQQLKTDFTVYLDGFSQNVQEILEKFKFRNQIDTMIEADILGAVIEKFVSPEINLSPDNIMNDVGGIRLPALDNHTMGTIFEELIRKFNEENNEEAGEHYTPRDVVELMADCIFIPIADKIKDSTYSCYDCACGTGGMLTEAQDRLNSLAIKRKKKVSIHLFGQELQAETYAIAKADMILKGDGDEAKNIAFGSTITNDGFASSQFDFMMSNPPYGKSWKVDAEKLGGKKDITDSRFVTSHGGNDSYAMLPRSSDGQMLFLLNNISKMKTTTKLGSRIAEVHNGSSLFTGDAGGGESNARRYMIENDLIEAIIALPENMFYNTGIGTFIWILSNKKDEKRKDKIQLIDATNMKSPLRKNLGNKNCELTKDIRVEIVKLYMDMSESAESKIFDNKEFGYYKVTVNQPEKHIFTITEEKLNNLPKILPKSKVWNWDKLTFNGSKMPENIVELKKSLTSFISDDIYYRRDEISDVLEAVFNEYDFTKKDLEKAIYSVFAEINEAGEIRLDSKGEMVVDTALTDTEQVPLTYKGGIDAFIEKEVKPFAPDALVDRKKTQIGYEISFTKYFYKPIKLRPLAEIVADIKALEKETDGLLNEIIGS